MSNKLHFIIICNIIMTSLIFTFVWINFVCVLIQKYDIYLYIYLNSQLIYELVLIFYCTLSTVIRLIYEDATSSCLRFTLHHNTLILHYILINCLMYSCIYFLCTHYACVIQVLS